MAQACVEVHYLVVVVVHPFESGKVFVEELTHQWVQGPFVVVVDERVAQLWGRIPHVYGGLDG